MTNNPDSFDNPDNLSFITIEPETPTAETLTKTIYNDLINGCAETLTENDVEARILVSVVANGVFVASFKKTKDGDYQLIDVPVTSVYEMWLLQQAQYDPEKGRGWISAEFVVEKDGSANIASYNWDNRVYFSSVSPENWYVRPEEEDEDNKSVWSDEQYLAGGIQIA